MSASTGKYEIVRMSRGYFVVDRVGGIWKAPSQAYADLGDATALMQWLRERAAGYPPNPKLAFDPSTCASR